MQKSEKIVEMKTDHGLSVRSYHDEVAGRDVMSFESTWGYHTHITMYSFINRLDYGWNKQLADHVNAVFDVYYNQLSGGEAIVFAMLRTISSKSSKTFGYELHIASLSDNIRLFKIADADGQLVPLDTLNPEEAIIIGKAAVIENDKYNGYMRKSSSL